MRRVFIFPILKSHLLVLYLRVDLVEVHLILRLVDLQILVDLTGDLLQLGFVHAVVLLSYAVGILSMPIEILTQLHLFMRINTL